MRTLVTAEINGRDAANRRIRLKQAGFPALKNLETFDLTTSSIPRPTVEYLGSLDSGYAQRRTPSSLDQPAQAKVTA